MAGGSPATMPAIVLEYSEEENSRASADDWLPCRAQHAAPLQPRLCRRGEDHVALVAEGDFQNLGGVFDKAEDADDRRRVD